ncbi:MetQ/NlpA family ABC transporter substrate-binding protein [Halarcobacter sp.]|uniref:MetQ/NlpA family ABC transporter substrate-binding protein n=1 Tax=Halarcobacter sp. TaxID=2321133 RepID=UPI002AAAE49A|nr:MetQ/NlpA family ABC transporter substrate-binding protein [Halarcobacter sp.]
MLKTISSIFFITILSLFFISCTDNQKNKKFELEKNVIKVGATPIPHGEILEFIRPLLKEKGYDLEIKNVTDYVTANIAVDEGELDANFFQHAPYLYEFNKNRKTHLVKTVSVHLEPMGLYSRKIHNIKNLENESIIAIPNDTTNKSRALDLLESIGLLTFKNVSFKTVLDIEKNPKNLFIKELDAAQLPRILSEIDAAVINTNYALSANLNPLKDSIAIESKDSKYANIIAVKRGNEKKDYIKVLNNLLNSKEVKEFIRNKYKGSIVEAF